VTATIVAREVPQAASEALCAAGVHPVMARLLAARGIRGAQDLDEDLAGLLPPDGLMGIDRAAALLADAARDGRAVLVIADYDCDGATACAVAVRGLRALGLTVDYLVPNRFEHGYGLTPAIVELAAHHPRVGRPSTIVTVDNGIASVDGVERARTLGIEVLVTDHHLPGDSLPRAAAIVDPNQPGCGFASKSLAGVGVMFYVLLALRAELRSRGAFERRPEPALQSLLDLVALGTVADLVRLDRNNRLLVSAGLRRIRAGRCQPGVAALFEAAGRERRRASADDMGFALGPRINAAGRLADISVGVECLLADDPVQADALARQLDAINRERRDIETRMRDEALADARHVDDARRTLTVFRDDWHEGVVGLVASRLKDRHHRPVIAFAPSAAQPSMLRGSGRSIAGVHLRDALDLVSKRDPALIERFGGHAMAAGLTLAADRFERFCDAFERAVADSADPGVFEPRLLTDGPLAPAEFDPRLVDEIERTVWGQGFPAPLFADVAQVVSQRLLKDRHLRLELLMHGRRFAAIWFSRTEPLPPRARIAYRLQRDDYRGPGALQLVVEAAEPLEPAADGAAAHHRRL